MFQAVYSIRLHLLCFTALLRCKIFNKMLVESPLLVKKLPEQHNFVGTGPLTLLKLITILYGEDADQRSGFEAKWATSVKMSLLLMAKRTLISSSQLSCCDNSHPY